MHTKINIIELKYYIIIYVSKSNKTVLIIFTIKMISIKETLKKTSNSLFLPITLVSSVLFSGAYVYNSSKPQRLFRRSKNVASKINYETYIRKSFERLGLSLYSFDWEKIAENNKKIEEMFKYHATVIHKITEIKQKINKTKEGDIKISQEEAEFVKSNKSADNVFYSLLYKYSVFMLREKKTVVS